MDFNVTVAGRGINGPSLQRRMCHCVTQNRHTSPYDLHFSFSPQYNVRRVLQQNQCFFSVFQSVKTVKNIGSYNNDFARKYFYRPRTKYDGMLCFYRCLVSANTAVPHSLVPGPFQGVPQPLVPCPFWRGTLVPARGTPVSSWDTPGQGYPPRTGQDWVTPLPPKPRQNWDTPGLGTPWAVRLLRSPAGELSCLFMLLISPWENTRYRLSFVTEPL